ncbi:PAS domain S-box protein [Halobaculum sp. EA56]|uniref:PAS domain S-box protein n=1 Tax=Halobaculum sp. EA56 TaxID=3421648 RepID=UPI003EBE3458
MGEPLRVLYIDDEVDLAESVAAFLERGDDRFEVETVPDASEGLDRLDAREFDCLVSEYDLPDGNGVELLTTVRETRPALPFVLFTGAGSEEVASDAISAGVTEYLRKGSDPERYRLLRNRISDAVDRGRAEREYREIFEEVPDGIVVHDVADGEFVDVNEEFARMFGYERDDLLAAGFERILPDEPPYTPERARQRIREAADDGPETFDWPGVTSDGERLWVEVHLTPLRPRGEERVLAVVRECTTRKERERDLERYQTVIDTVPDMAYVLDPDFRFALVNDAMVDVTGYPREDLLGAHASLLFDDEAIDEGEWNRDRLRSGARESERLETRLETADGERIPCEIRGDLLPRGGEGEWRGTTGIIRDVTERKERERKLQARSAAMDASIDGMAILDADEEYVFVNRAHVDCYGYDDPDAFLGETWRMCYGPEELARFEEEIMPELFEQGDWRGETVGVRADGSTFPQELSLSLTDDGRVICVVRDVTERKRRERGLERQNEQLEQFARVVSHDLRNPLNVVEGRLELAREESESAHLDSAADALDRCLTLVDDLLTLAREGRRVDEREPVDLGALAEDCWRTVDTADAALVADATRTVRADRSRLKQLLENLMRNAVEHGGAGVTVAIGDLENGFYVADDGPGVPDDAADEVFEPGYSTADDGTGFGLNIVAEIAEAHGWDVAVAESPAGGAQFAITGVDADE